MMRPDGLFHVLKNTETGKYYKTFEIPKKRGDTRSIDKPLGGLAMAQERFAAVLLEVYNPKPFVHGYVRGRSFLSNAQYHQKQRWILNIDIEDFFGSIGFARVRGLFMSTLFGYNDRVATILARICTYQNRLPQGAKTSPTLANLIAHNLDKELISLAAKENLRFSRYADDITFSSSSKKIRTSLIKEWEPEYGEREVELGKRLEEAFRASSFNINRDKTRIQLFGERQVVTGLIVNQSPNVWRKDVKRLRMKLYSAKKYGLDQAAELWIGPRAKPEAFWAHVEGWLGYIKQVRGEGDAVLSKLCKQAIEANPNSSDWIQEHAYMMHEFDLFLSHASEDKPRVRKLYEKLVGLDVKVFFDESSITWGDSIVDQINIGLMKSNFFVPFLSSTFAAKGWTNKELNSAISININRKGRILPICDHDFHVGQNYPLLADILYESWPGPDADEEAKLNEIADKLLAAAERAKHPQ
ncbi:TIR domain-containing protein [Nitratireductor aquibiodomus]|uniref:RNA-directed DNA polymerase n=2 Tax=Nitratireductor aquibiodomus TaxID=204799 RepID=A0A1H4LDA5_9HYPH|nr:TIR domain-containing anti-phage reverse transcriptase [Nitratireductor aquibiodomus]SEB68506.1 TIR domain-containing protein [Nitratireductor aquibiodomus]